MPTYDYVCKNCGKKFEKFQKMSDPPLTVCKECGGSLKKNISAPYFILKGTGWFNKPDIPKSEKGKK